MFGCKSPGIPLVAVTLFIGATLLIGAGASFGSEGDGYAGPGELVTIFHDSERADSLIMELGITRNQWEHAAQLAESFRQELQGRHSHNDVDPEGDERIRSKYNEAIMALFDPTQIQKLKRISLREKGVAALTESDVAERLQLSPAQRDKIHEACRRADAELQDALNKLPRLTEEGLQRLRKQFQERKTSAVLALLTPEQRHRWEELVR